MYDKYYSKFKGVYCFMPYENIDNKNKTIIKIGNTSVNFQTRLQQYHTYYINGIYVLFFIKIEPKHRVEYPTNFKQIINYIENYILSQIQDNGGIILVNQKRTYNAGRSEWVYDTLGNIKKIFIQSAKHFSKIYKDLIIYDDCVNISKTKQLFKKEQQKQLRNIDNTFTTHYVYDISKLHNKPRKKLIIKEPPNIIWM